MENKQQGSSKTVLIMAGGTGGHVMPALAVAAQLKEKGHAVHWLGTEHGIEKRLVTDAKIPISFIDIQGLRGKGWGKIISAPFKLIRALWQSHKVLRKVKPNAVLSMGGYVAGPGGVAAWLNRVPLLVHEQNAVSGLTNRLLAPFARIIMISFPGAFKKTEKVKETGNPVRKEILQIRQTKSKIDVNNEIKILILGGSQGAKSLNSTLPEVIANISGEIRPVVWHQTGSEHFDFTNNIYEKLQVEATVVPFIDDMAKAYDFADIVICRAGALTIAELATAGVPSILIPFPYAVDDHQTKNAKYLADSNAAILINHSDLTVSKLKELLLQLMEHKQILSSMAVKCHSLAHPDATKKVAHYCQEVMNCAK